MKPLVCNKAPDFYYSRLNDAFGECDEILIATAYISPGGCELLQLQARADTMPMRLVVGRAVRDGLPHITRKYLLSLEKKAEQTGGGVRVDPNTFHSKVMCAHTKLGAVAGLGSSNLTEHGMQDWTEANLLVSGELAEVCVAETRRLYNGGVPLSDIIDSIPVPVTKTQKLDHKGDEVEKIPVEPGEMDTTLTISLLDANGEVPEKSGLNWCFGEGRKRDRFECYIRLPKSALSVADEVFGDARKGVIVRARTHDGKTFPLKLQGSSKGGSEEPKQISTFGDNSQLGEWMLRECLKKPNKVRITRKDLDKYGRTTVTRESALTQMECLSCISTFPRRLKFCAGI